MLEKESLGCVLNIEKSYLYKVESAIENLLEFVSLY
jgi:hypothetical protein